MKKILTSICFVALLSNCAPVDPASIDQKEPEATTINTVQKPVYDNTIPVPVSDEVLEPGLHIGAEGTYEEKIVTFFLRPNKAGDWRFLTEGNHEKHPAVDRVLTYHDRVEVFYKDNVKYFDQVFGFGCMVDLQLSQEDITCGVSGGIGKIIIKFKKIGVPGPMDPTTVPTNWTNISVMVHGYRDTVEGASVWY